jgi:hypothetical protein
MQNDKGVECVIEFYFSCYAYPILKNLSILFAEDSVKL